MPQLAVLSDYDGAQGIPYVNATNAYGYGASIYCAVTNSPLALGDPARTQYVCKGWVNGSGNVPASGLTDNFQIDGLTQDSSLTWHWGLQYLLNATATGSGTVSGGGWKDQNAVASLTATAAWGNQFDSWSGDTGGGTINGNQVSLPMSRARVVAATFLAETTAPLGTRIAWLRLYGLTNYASSAAAELDDPDGDTKRTWEEFYTGTDPTNKASVFRVLEIVYLTDSNSVSFYGTTNSGVTTPFGMYRATELAPQDWTLVTNSIPRDPTGINRWWDMTPPDVKAFYQPVWTNTTP
jgi:hypothetical protein